MSDIIPFGKGRLGLELESVQRAIDEAASWAGSEYARRIRGATRGLLGIRHGGGGVMGEPESRQPSGRGSVQQPR